MTKTSSDFDTSALDHMDIFAIREDAERMRSQAVSAYLNAGVAWIKNLDFTALFAARKHG